MRLNAPTTPVVVSPIAAGLIVIMMSAVMTLAGLAYREVLEVRGRVSHLEGQMSTVLESLQHGDGG